MLSIIIYILIIIIFFIYILNFKTSENFESYKETGYFKDWFDWDDNWRSPWESNKCRKNGIKKWYWY